MRQNTESIALSFKAGIPKRNGSKTTDGTTFFLHGNAIARKDRGRLEICWAGWVTATTAECINGVLDAYNSDFRVCRKKGQALSRNWRTQQEAPMDDNTWQAVSDAKL